MATGEPGPVDDKTVADDEIKHKMLLCAAFGGDSLATPDLEPGWRGSCDDGITDL
jgi:hypothetical protein